jgi:hypothetical protein
MESTHFSLTIFHFYQHIIINNGIFYFEITSIFITIDLYEYTRQYYLQKFILEFADLKVASKHPLILLRVGDRWVQGE